MRDIGANLTGKQFTKDLGEVITRARLAGVDFIDITGTDLESSRKSIALARAHLGFFGATAGIHPHGAKNFDATAERELAGLARQAEVLMCGEMGLDFARNFSTPGEQVRAFEAQITIAAEIGKPLFLHCREAFEPFIATLDKTSQVWPRSIVHCFTGTRSEAEALIERGAHIGVTGWVTDKRRNQSLLEAIKSIPIDRLLLETDAPYLMPLNAPKSQARDRNEPANLPWVALALSELYGCSVEELAVATTQNADRLIGRTAPLLSPIVGSSPSK